MELKDVKVGQRIRIQPITGPFSVTVLKKGRLPYTSEYEGFKIRDELGNIGWLAKDDYELLGVLDVGDTNAQA